MKKRLTALLCTAALCVSLLMPSAFAAGTTAGEGEALQVLAAMGVMNGDEKGNLDLSANVTRAAFTKMAVAASTYRDMATSTAHVSPFFGCKIHALGGGVYQNRGGCRLDQRLSDGTFRPDSPVYLEQAVNICLKMLGYTDEDFATGTYPYPQLAMYQNLKLNTGLNAKQGQVLTRGDCAKLVYNTLNATTKDGKVYATTLGYSVDGAGKIDYLSVINAELQGPIVVGEGSWTSQLGFTPSVVYRNDGESTLSAITQNDVVYYLEKTKTVWAYHNQVTGLYESAEPNRSNPTSVVVSGVSYL